MNKQLLVGLASASLALASQAAGLPSPGQKISQEQIAQWGKLPAYQVGKSVLRAIPERPADGQSTLLLNAQDIVGVSYNEVAISQVEAQVVQNQMRQIVPQPLSLQHFEQAGVTMAKYADFNQAYEAWKAIQAAMPEAQVRLPVRFGQVRPY